MYVALLEVIDVIIFRSTGFISAVKQIESEHVHVYQVSYEVTLH